jgi:cobalt/nickel transport system ATP-binding protein
MGPVKELRQKKKVPVLSVRELYFGYSKELKICSGISLEVHEGERLGMVGPNGSGKTTLMLLLCGVLKPDSGTITFEEKPIAYKAFNPQVTYLFQSPDNQLFSSTVLDDVAFGPLNTGLSPEEAAEASRRALEMTGCSGLSDRSPHHLSGGEKRLVAIASLLSLKPKVLLFDEPESSLDSRNRRRLIQLTHSLPGSLIVASHDLEFLLETCSRVIVVDEGKICAEGEIRDIFNDEKLLLRHGLEKPHSLIPHTGSGHVHLASHSEDKENPH